MEIKKSLFLLLVLSGLELMMAAEEKQVSHNHNIHDLKHREKSPKHRAKHYNTKCFPQRCNIICPIQVQPPPSNQNPVPIPLPVTIATPPSKVTQDYTLPSLIVPATGPPPNQTIPKPPGILPQLANNLGPYLGRGFSNLLGTNRNHLINLRNGQKGIILKQFIFRTKGRKKSYRLIRQYAPFGCYVQCEELQTGQQIPSQLPTEGSEPDNTTGDDDGEDEPEEPYHEGEDKPIEITVSPPDRSKLLIDNSAGPEILLEDKIQ